MLSFLKFCIPINYYLYKTIYHLSFKCRQLNNSTSGQQLKVNVCPPWLTEIISARNALKQNISTRSLIICRNFWISKIYCIGWVSTRLSVIRSINFAENICIVDNYSQIREVSLYDSKNLVFLWMSVLCTKNMISQIQKIRLI